MSGIQYVRQKHGHMNNIEDKPAFNTAKCFFIHLFFFAFYEVIMSYFQITYPSNHQKLC